MKKLILSLVLGVGVLATPFMVKEAKATPNLDLTNVLVCYNSRMLINKASDCWDSNLRIRTQVTNYNGTGGGLSLFFYDLLGKPSVPSGYLYYVNANSVGNYNTTVRGVFCGGVAIRLYNNWCGRVGTFIEEKDVANSKIYPCQ